MLPLMTTSAFSQAVLSPTQCLPPSHPIYCAVFKRYHTIPHHTTLIHIIPYHTIPFTLYVLSMRSFSGWTWTLPARTPRGRASWPSSRRWHGRPTLPSRQSWLPLQSLAESQTTRDASTRCDSIIQLDRPHGTYCTAAVAQQQSHGISHPMEWNGRFRQLLVLVLTQNLSFVFW